MMGNLLSFPRSRAWHPDAVHEPIGAYAGLGIRAGAFLLDFVPIMLLATVFVLPIPILSPIYRPALDFAMVVVGWLWMTLFESSRMRATPGKRLLRLVVTDEDGHRLSFGRAGVRNVAKFLLAGPFGLAYLMILASDRKQALHDRMAGTLVTRRLREPASSPR
jgi:uncharacterized RDD family membrane protein YckC